MHSPPTLGSRRGPDVPVLGVTHRRCIPSSKPHGDRHPDGLLPWLWATDDCTDVHTLQNIYRENLRRRLRKQLSQAHVVCHMSIGKLGIRRSPILKWRLAIPDAPTPQLGTS